ncbi:acyl- dehydrogenase [Fusarium albosuccineum]|uniref:Acyl- dehydrogenase n=1 Tax=Fusarium albosuccineum TaxID=1237068 RepID=A0A8H4PCG6_9HYPO|nr:acyl- dehydrogenase [Fusarium albosuccineum]
MSARIPAIAANRVSDAAKKQLDLVARFVEEECIPADPVVEAQTGEGEARWEGHPSIIEDLKTKARALGLWNMFLPKGHYKESPGWTNLEYGLMAEWMGRSHVASEACNCAAPDTGNMEVLARYGNDAQKEQWLKPLMDGKIRSAFLMTEPQVASSDATNIEMSIHREGNEYVLNGQKWWSSGAGDPRCSIYIVMGKTDPNNKDPYQQQSVVLVPANTPGITINRMLKVYGYDDAPHGHGHVTFENVRVPVSNLVLGEGRGFEIIQGRLGPGRIHHAMRSIGAAERALDWMLLRVNDESKKPFGKLLREHGVILEWIAKSRLEIDAARLIVLNAAIKMDDLGPKKALKEIAQAKVLIPQTALTVIDRAVQAFGGAGVCQDTPLAYMWAGIRTLRLADGPDEVHLQQMGRNENKRGAEATATIQRQRAKTEELLKAYGVERKQPGATIKHNAKLQFTEKQEEGSSCTVVVPFHCPDDDALFVLVLLTATRRNGRAQRAASHCGPAHIPAANGAAHHHLATVSSTRKNAIAYSIASHCNSILSRVIKFLCCIKAYSSVTLSTTTNTFFTMSAKVLADKDVNAPMAAEQQAPGKEVKSMEYHRQVLQSKMAQEESTAKYISPSDNIMSPCTAKINALRNKHANKAKPKSLFAQASAKKLQSDNPFGAKPAPAKAFEL